MGKEVATLAGGCFWCTEAVFRRLKGVEKVVSGYSGGKIKNPTYEQVSLGQSGHAEAVQITFDPKTISFEDIVNVFFKFHDPTTLNRQGADVGTQYRSAIFYHNDKQKEIAKKIKNKFEKERIYDSPIVTEITPYNSFYPAEAYHKDYYEKNKDNRYCQAVIDPKIVKLQKDFKEYLRKET